MRSLAYLWDYIPITLHIETAGEETNFYTILLLLPVFSIHYFEWNINKLPMKRIPPRNM